MENEIKLRQSRWRVIAVGRSGPKLYKSVPATNTGSNDVLKQQQLHLKHLELKKKKTYERICA